MNFVTEICIITTTASLEHCYDFLIFYRIKKKNCCLIMNTFKQFCVSETDKTNWTCDVVTHKGKPTTAKCEKGTRPSPKTLPLGPLGPLPPEEHPEEHPENTICSNIKMVIIH